MKFPLADWIDGHPGVRHDLARSGMAGAVQRPALTAAELRSSDADELRDELATSLRVPADRLFLTHGGTEANAWVFFYIARSLGRRSGVCRVSLPEYPPLFDGPRTAGFEITTAAGAADLAVTSQPRNPEGDEWGPERLFQWAGGARHVLLDETFREFGERRSYATLSRERLWTTGSFTKFYAGDDLRVGFVIAPETDQKPFGRFVGLFADEIAPASVAGALSALRHRARIGEEVRRLVATNRRVLARTFPVSTPPVGPVWFDRTGARSPDLVGRLLRASVLVCPGSYFGDPSGNRLCLTRRSFPADLAAYVAVRGPEGAPGVTSSRSTPRPPVRPPRGANARGRAGRA
ncbi:MAG TPA: aminotransferase class I/II-fold pyridoxal phosphate-dependent enzyme [Thermoplasmata archaeon]|nr:aminotransferase class I/II-fold pyridoxal phosphate-dependent enzyme [Thermoplasmata archaeon]